MSDARVHVTLTATDTASERIAELCCRLAGLLDDPQPGLMTWVQARNRTGVELRDALNEQIEGSSS